MHRDRARASLCQSTSRRHSTRELARAAAHGRRHACARDCMRGRRRCWRGAPKASAPRSRFARTAGPPMRAASSRIMALGVRHGDEVLIQAEGERSRAGPRRDDRRHSRKLRGWRLRTPAPRARCRAAPAAQPAPRRTGEMTGICAVPGFAVGRATRIERREIDVIEAGSGKRSRTRRARTGASKRATAGWSACAMRAAPRGSEIIAAHLEFLDDPTLNEARNELIAAGKSAGFAWRGATRRSIAALESLDDSRLRERADDLLDVEAHVLAGAGGGGAAHASAAAGASRPAGRRFAAVRIDGARPAALGRHRLERRRRHIARRHSGRGHGNSRC